MVIHLITFSAIQNRQGEPRQGHEVILSELERYFTLHFIEPEDIGRLGPDDFSLIFLATGGVERLVAQHFEALPRPIFLLADGMQNSLAAALEISAWMRARGVKNEILHGRPADMVRRVFTLHNNHLAQRRLAGARIGVVGTPAPWLIASHVDGLLAKRRWGISFVDVPLEEVATRMKRITDDEVGDRCAQLAARAMACREAEPEDMLSAMRVYHALHQIAEEMQLSALTLNCTRLHQLTGVTGCLALSLLNDDGFVAGCEGDLQTVFTMLAVRALVGRSSFMGNPALVDRDTNELVLTHCTIGLKQCERYILRSHYETGTSIGIQGIVPQGRATLLKCGGECLDQYYLTTAHVTDNTNYLNLCRTQVRLRLDTSVDYFLRTPLGNHHVLLQGDHLGTIDEFFQTNGCLRIG